MYMNELLLEARDVSKFFGNKPVLNNINISIGSGKLIGLLGPNGSAKSTLIKLCNG